MNDIEAAVIADAKAQEIYGIQYATDMDGNGPDAWLPNITELANDMHRWSEMLAAGQADEVKPQLDKTKNALALALKRKW